MCLVFFENHKPHIFATLPGESHDFQWHLDIHWKYPYRTLKDVNIFDSKQGSQFF